MPAAPADLGARERAQLAAVGAASTRVDGIVHERASVAGVEPWRGAAVHTFGATDESLTASTRIPASVSDRGERARRLAAIVFPEGTEWVKQDAYAVWGECDRIVAMIQERGLEAELDAVVGAGTFAAMQKATVDLGEVLGTGTTPRTLPEGRGLQDRHAVLPRGRALRAHARRRPGRERPALG